MQRKTIQHETTRYHLRPLQNYRRYKENSQSEKVSICEIFRRYTRKISTYPERPLNEIWEQRCFCHEKGLELMLKLSLLTNPLMKDSKILYFETKYIGQFLSYDEK